VRDGGRFGYDGRVHCPCGNDVPLDDCCGRFIRAGELPETAEQLMRARYTAYTMQEVDYIIATHVADGEGDVDRASTEKWAAESQWLGLEIVDTVAGGAGDDRGEVEFIARYRLQGTEAAHHERGRFQRVDGRWLYLDGEMVKPKPTVRATPKVGRNDPCPCGSGFKYKKCCGRG